MTLEDHAGDIIRKARQMAAVSLESAAQAAGIRAAELTVLEESGRCAAQPDYVKLANLLGLHPLRLKQIAQGWIPKSVNLSAWRHLRQITSADGGLSVHCYLAWDEETREAALFDTGLDFEPIEDLLATESLRLRHLFITHSHYDHVQALGEVRKKYAQAVIHSNNMALAPQRNKPDAIVSAGRLRISSRDTPGHAADGATYIIGGWPTPAPSVAIVGDALFAGSMGGAAGHGTLAKEMVRQQILTLPADALVCPGHGPLTTVGQEQNHNPFFP